MSTTVDFTPTLDFLKDYLGTTKTKIIEVGGDGRLAAQLKEAGHEVTTVADLLEYESAESFDVALFNGSFSYVGHLGRTLDKVKKVLGERGRIVVEDFSLEHMDEPTAEWFYELRDVVDLLTNKLSTPGETPLDRWKAEHHHEPALHTRREMFSALESKFGNIHAYDTPYLFKYFSGNEATERIAQWEKRLIKKNQIQPMGLRIVAKKYFSYLR